ncbi:hypothetical protein E3O42_15685 [Cryobacterium adonitolivorans]|uniref:Uncharacterized protein n=1 Tax=Cryobacterium adonitolivorans TaxID=1259189 RepID=A0A4R8W197_9MICO|nr:hypothetical protein [Cryobacterium adonitolivorans]TFB97794.1 hypothetical protein E3O42_15685 [Cryobacterium adonitolivorans]
MTLGNSPQPLTRRQLRELAREHEPSTGETDSAQETSTGDIVLPADASAVADAPAGPVQTDPVQAHPVQAHPVQAEPHHSRHTTPADTDAGRTLTRRELRALQAASSASAAEDVSVHEQVAPSPVAPSPVASSPVSAPRSGSDDETKRSDGAAAVNALHPPVGHWSVDREDDSHIETIGRRDDATFDDLVGRGVGAGGMPTTTNALILPSIPRQGPGGPITSTGEIMITGSIDLPRSLGATGQHPNLFDSSEMDRMLDQLDEGGHHNDVAPVSASRAVSTHTSTRGVMTPPRKRGASLPTVLAITAAVLAIGVLSLFVLGYAFNIY